ncbi:MAG: LCP family protein, partial [Candidatus Microbacterium stercoravium]
MARRTRNVTMLVAGLVLIALSGGIIAYAVTAGRDPEPVAESPTPTATPTPSPTPTPTPTPTPEPADMPTST